MKKTGKMSLKPSLFQGFLGFIAAAIIAGTVTLVVNSKSSNGFSNEPLSVDEISDNNTNTITQDKDIRMEVIWGKVLDTHGSPIENAKVTIEIIKIEKADILIRYTNSEGYYRFERIFESKKQAAVKILVNHPNYLPNPYVRDFSLSVPPSIEEIRLSKKQEDTNSSNERSKIEEQKEALLETLDTAVLASNMLIHNRSKEILDKIEALEIEESSSESTISMVQEQIENQIKELEKFARENTDGYKRREIEEGNINFLANFNATLASGSILASMHFIELKKGIETYKMKHKSDFEILQMIKLELLKMKLKYEEEN